MGIFSGENKPQVAHGPVDSIIGSKAKFKGELISSGAVSVNGEFEGKISTKGEVIVARGSKVLGDIEAGSVIVSGKVNGNITADHQLEIAKTGRVHGDLVGGRITIEEGSSYRGRVKVAGAKEEVEEDEVEEEQTEIVEEAPVNDQEVSQAPMFK